MKRKEKRMMYLYITCILCNIIRYIKTRNNDYFVNKSQFD